MKDLYLKFTDAGEMKGALLAVGFKETEEEPKYLYHDEMQLDIIGLIYHAEDASSGDAEYSALPGYHSNLRVLNDELDLSPLAEFIVKPSTPARVWA